MLIKQIIFTCTKKPLRWSRFIGSLTIFIFIGNLIFASDPELKPKLGDINRKSKEPLDPFIRESARPRNHPQEPSIEDNYQLIQDVTDEFYKKGLKALREKNLTTAEGYFDRVLVIKPNHKGARQGIAQIMKMYDKTEPKKKEIPAAKTNAQEKLIQSLSAQLDKKMAESNYEDAKSIVAELLAVDPQNSSARRKSFFIHQKLAANAINRAQEREDAGDERGAIDAYLLAMNYGRDDSLKEKVASLRERLHQKNKTTSAKLYLEALKATQQGDNQNALKLCRRALALDPKNLQAQRMLERLADKH